MYYLKKDKKNDFRVNRYDTLVELNNKSGPQSQEVKKSIQKIIM